MHADRQTDGWANMTKLNALFVNYAKAPGKVLEKIYIGTTKFLM